MARRRSASHTILVVEAEPEVRLGGRALDRALSQRRAAGAAAVERWYLRSRVAPSSSDRAWVVDDLRLWGPARLLTRLGLEVPAGKLKAAHLRVRLFRLRPEIVVLVGGAGAELVKYVSGRPKLVDLAQPGGGTAERSVPGSGSRVGKVIEEPPAFVFDGLAETSAAFERRARDAAVQRAELGVPADAVLVEGWGEDGWLDNPDAFVRGLWYLEHRHGIVAHGLWSGLVDPADLRRLRDEAARCGLSERLHLRETGVGAPVADVVVLTHRTPRPDIAAECVPAMLAGRPIVCFATCGPFDRAMRTAAPLDVAALARAVAEELELPDSARRAELLARWSEAADRFLDELSPLSPIGRSPMR